jgi:hypothetical protein
MAANAHDTTGTHTPRIIVSWLVVGIPLIYGFSQTVKNAIHLFTG